MASIFPTDSTSTSTSTDSTDKLGRTFKFDYDTKEFTLENGKLVEPTRVEAIEQWIKLYILTDILKYKVYDESFGVDLSDLISYRLPRGYQVAEIERRITEGILSNCPEVDSIKSWTFDKGHFRFTCVLTDESEVNINV